METDEKQCLRCAETVKAEAKVCRHCGYDFVTGQAPAAPAAPNVVVEKPSKAKGVLSCLGLIVVLLVALGIIGALADSDKSEGTASTEETAAASAEPPMPVTARELARAYDANEAAAQQQYGKRRLQVSGTVAGVDLDFTDKPVVQLVGENEFMPVHAPLVEASQAKASSLSKGDQIILVCAGVGEIIGTPMLKDCAF